MEAIMEVIIWCLTAFKLQTAPFIIIRWVEMSEAFVRMVSSQDCNKSPQAVCKLSNKFLCDDDETSDVEFAQRRDGMCERVQGIISGTCNSVYGKVFPFFYSLSLIHSLDVMTWHAPAAAATSSKDPYVKCLGLRLKHMLAFDAAQRERCRYLNISRNYSLCTHNYYILICDSDILKREFSVHRKLAVSQPFACSISYYTICGISYIYLWICEILNHYQIISSLCQINCKFSG